MSFTNQEKREIFDKLKAPQYIGDGVYVAFDGYHLVISVPQGCSVANTIFLEDRAWCALVRYVKRIREIDPQLNILWECKNGE